MCKNIYFLNFVSFFCVVKRLKAMTLRKIANYHIYTNSSNYKGYHRLDTQDECAALLPGATLRFSFWCQF